MKLEENSRSSTACLSKLTEKVIMEQAKCHKATEEQMELLRQLHESLNVEKIERCAGEKSSKALVEEHHVKQEASMQELLELIQHERSERCRETVLDEERIRELSETFSENRFKSLWDEMQMNNQTNLDALAQESACRKGDKYSQQVGLQELCEKTDVFKAEINHMMIRLWNAIEMHTHEVCMDDVVDKANSMSAMTVTTSAARCRP